MKAYGVLKTRGAISSVALALACTAAFANPAGVWDVEGKDTSGTEWKGILVLNVNEKQPKAPEEKEMTWLPPTQFYGYFEWKGSNATGGREYVAGSYDYEKKVLSLGGRTLEKADPNIIQARYRANSDDKCTTLDGDWDGPAVVPGTWKAIKRRDEAGKRPSRRR